MQDRVSLLIVLSTLRLHKEITRPNKQEIVNYTLSEFINNISEETIEGSFNQLIGKGIINCVDDIFEVHLGVRHIYVEILQYDDTNENLDETIAILDKRIKDIEKLD
ncbi:hypothetical protein [Paenibacillus sp. FSL K6-2524]|uniref:hypothetical protein n=1 Tax=Paenibacillus sp. FSL K6-2524 TaxID=2954516 RepID=UPI0030F6CE97